MDVASVVVVVPVAFVLGACSPPVKSLPGLISIVNCGSLLSSPFKQDWEKQLKSSKNNCT
jgi:hypothetical protein